MKYTLLSLSLLFAGCVSVTDPVTGKTTRSLSPAAQAALDRITQKALDLGVSLAERKLDDALRIKSSGK